MGILAVSWPYRVLLVMRVMREYHVPYSYILFVDAD